METTALSPERPRFTDLNIRPEMQFNFDEERELLQELTFGREIDSEFVEQLNRELATGTAPLPGGNSAEVRESRATIYQARDAFFALLGFDDPQHQLNGAFRRAKTLSNVESPSPAALVISARLMKGMAVPVTRTLQKANKFLYTVPDIDGLDSLESTFQQYNLSIWDNPVLAAQSTEHVEPRLSQLHSSLRRLRLPITVAEVVSAEPSVLRHAEERMSLLADLAMAHASLRQYIRSPHKRAGGKYVPLRERLARDICAALGSYTSEVHMFGILEHGTMGLTQARQVKRQFLGVISSREALLDRLSSNNVERIGPAIVGSYFAQKPLTERERQRFPSLVKLSPPAKPAQSPEKIVHAEPLDEEDMPWLEEIMARAITNEEKESALSDLNDALIKGSRPLRGADEATKNEIISHRREFFRLLGWTMQGHPMYYNFMGCLKRGAPPRPDSTTTILRTLAEPAKGQLIGTAGRYYCATLRRNPTFVQQRINIATNRAKRRCVPVGQVLNEHAGWFFGPIPIDIPDEE